MSSTGGAQLLATNGITNQEISAGDYVSCTLWRDKNSQTGKIHIFQRNSQHKGEGRSARHQL